jgi:DNA-binding CsgD family transcriptional regulator
MGKLAGKEQEITEKYESGLSTYDLQSEYGVSRETIRKHLKRCGVSIRGQAEINHMRWANHTRLSDRALNMVSGWLLGDGSIWYTGKQAYFCLTSKHKEYVDYAKDIMEKEGLGCRINKVIDKKYKSVAYKLFTSSTIQFAELYNIWYKNGKKIVPKNIKLTKTAVKNWIMDDGTKDKKKGHLRLCTCSFTVDECEYLSSELNKMLGDSGASWVIEKKKYPRIYIPKRFVNKLYDKIGKCDVSCFAYKWTNSSKNIEGGASF